MTYADERDYREQEDKEDAFIKKYAARIPALEIGTERSLFAAVQFPVLFKKPTDLVDPKPEGKFDPIFIEAADYDDGFAKIVHAFQPVSQNLLLEESDGFHPTKDVGIRLGWDDEQILIWYMRQMMEDETIPSGGRIDSPIGVFGYRIDVKKQGAAGWESLNKVKNKVPLTINGNDLADFDDELLYQVFPSQLDGDKDKSYWLPMYFANWHGKSMVLPDEDAVSIYQNDQGDVQAESGTHITGPAQTGLAKMYKPEPITTALQYGNTYEFRVRLGDLTSGGPDKKAPPAHEGPSPTGTCHFKRYVAPNTVRIDDVPVNSDQLVFDKDKLVVKRPLLGYPSVVFTGKYVDAVDLLKKAAKEQVDTVRQNKKDIDDGHPEKVKPVEAFGIADPDVESVEVTVEVQALNMDYLLSVSGKESYCKLYTTRRKFPVGFDDELAIPLDYIDCNVLKFGDPSDLGDLGVNQTQLDGMAELVVPRARNIRLTLRALCKETPGYYGNETDNPDLNTRYGRTRHVMLYQPSEKEIGLFAATSEAKKIKGIYLQPDPPARLRREFCKPAGGQTGAEDARHDSTAGAGAGIGKYGTDAGRQEGATGAVRLFQQDTPHIVTRQLIHHLCQQGRPDESLALLPHTPDRPRLDLGCPGTRKLLHHPREAI